MGVLTNFFLFSWGLYCRAQLKKKSTSAGRGYASYLMVWAFLWILFQIILEKMGVSSAPACQLSSLSLLLHLCRWLHGWWHCLLLARKWFCCHRDGGARIASVHHYWAEAGQQGSGLHHRWVCDEGLWWNVQTFCWSTSMWLFLWFRCWGTNLGSRLQLRVLFHWKRGILAHQVCFLFLAASLQRLMGSFFFAAVVSSS